jgi:hypothetical protein
VTKFKWPLSRWLKFGSRRQLAEVHNIAEAARLMHNMIVADDLIEFLTLPAYELLD